MGVSNYPADFGAPVEIAPVEPTVLLGVSPLLLALLLVAALGFLALGWALGRRRPREEDAAPGLWKAIDAPLQAAMTANSDQRPGAARALKAAVDDRLGDVLKLGGGLSGPLDAIAEALGDRVQSHGHGHGHEHGHDDHGHAHDDAHDHRHDGHGAAAAHDDRRETASGVTVIQTGTVVLTPPAPGKPKPPHTPAPTPAQTPADRLATLRAAVVALNDHWCRKEDRLRDLRAARAALNR